MDQEAYYKAIIGVLRFIGFTGEEINAGIEALPDDGELEPKALVIQIGQNALKWIKEHGKK